MFDLSWSHIGLFVVIALLVLGPKELPNAIRTGAQLLRAGRKLAGEFRSGMDELMREAELEETRRSVKQAVTEGLDKTIDEHVDSTGELKTALQNPAIEATPADVDASPAAAPAGADDKPAEPAGELPGPPNVVINNPPPTPPDSVVPPPAEEADQPARPAAAPESAATETESEDLKKTA